MVDLLSKIIPTFGWSRVFALSLLRSARCKTVPINKGTIAAGVITLQHRHAEEQGSIVAMLEQLPYR